MTNIGETVSVGKILKHKKSNCYFCRENKDEQPNPVPASKSDADWEEDPDEIDNDSGELERLMRDNARKPRPTDWFIKETPRHTRKKHRVTPNPHHLIPGNESLKEVQDILYWIHEGQGLIENDIGYNVNNESNGIWLPSNNSMRNDPRWKDEDFKIAYAQRAMEEAGAVFHDRHLNPYSDFVKQILQKIANRMWGIDAQDPDCKYKTEGGSGDKHFKPPYALVSRLNGVSARLRVYLRRTHKPNRQVYTSALVAKVWQK